MRYGRLWLAFFKNCLTREIEYRGHFIMQFMVDVAWYAMQIAVFGLLYSLTPQIGGIGKAEATVFLGILFLTDGINMMLFSSNFWRVPYYITTGELDFFLLRPASVFFMVFTRYINLASVLNLALGLTVFVYGVQSLSYTPPISAWMQWCIMMMCAVVLQLSMQGIIASFAIFTVAADGIQFVYYTLARFGERPDTIYSGWMRRVVLYIIPFAMLASMPLRALTGTLSPSMFITSVALSVGFMTGAVLLFNFCLRKYSGASS
jgi:ABC-2 type transport system permease protein